MHFFMSERTDFKLSQIKKTTIRQRRRLQISQEVFVMKKEKQWTRYNLQFFAEGNEEEEQQEEQHEEQQLSVEEQLSQLMAEGKKWKAAFDKSSSEAAEFKKKYRESLSQKEQLDLEKAERDAKREADFDSMKRKLDIIGLEKSFLKLGYDEKSANQAANAQYDGDLDELFKVQQSYLNARDNKLKNDWMKSQPVPPSDNKDEEVDLFLKGFNS